MTDIATRCTDTWRLDAGLLSPGDLVLEMWGASGGGPIQAVLILAAVRERGGIRVEYVEFDDSGNTYRGTTFCPTGEPFSVSAAAHLHREGGG